jgi:hypothetical protein
MKKSIVAAGLTAGLLAGAGVVYALDSTGHAGASPLDRIAAVSVNGDSVTASTIALTGTDAGTDREANIRATLQPLVDDGTITADQLDKVVAALVAAGPGDGDGDGGMGHGGMRGVGLQTVADLLGITVDDVRTAIQGGTTLADLATQHGKTAQDVIDALVADATTHLDAEVKAGTITQAEADTRLTDATQRITDFVNNTQAAGPMGGGHDGHGPGGMGGMIGGGMGGTIDGGPADGTTTTTTG